MLVWQQIELRRYPASIFRHLAKSLHLNLSWWFDENTEKKWIFLNIHIYTHAWLRSQTKALNSQPFYSRTQKTATSPNMVDPSHFLSTSGKPYSKVSRTTTKGWPPESHQETKATASPQNKTSSWTAIQLLLKGSFPQWYLWEKWM